MWGNQILIKELTMKHMRFSTKIRYEYEQDASVEVKYAHGVCGEINPNGEIEVSFYLETDKLPANFTHDLETNAVAIDDDNPENQNTRVMTRKVHTKVLLNYNSARVFLDWLEEKVSVLEIEEDVYELENMEGRVEQ